MYDKIHYNKKNAHILIYKCKTVTIVTNTTDQSTIRNKMTKEFKIFKELTICGKGTLSEYTMLGKWCHRHVQCMITINFQFVMKHSICEPLLPALQCFKSMPVNQLKQVMKRDWLWPLKRMGQHFSLGACPILPPAFCVILPISGPVWDMKL